MFRKPKLLITGLAAFAAAVPLLAMAPGQARAATSAMPLNFVAIGDSYASGEGDIGAGWLDPACDRSAGAAPQRAATTFSSIRPVGFESFACSGATVEDLLAPAGQLAMVDPDRNEPVDALTLSIGGNDLGFAQVVLACAGGDACNTDPAITGMVAAGFAKLRGTSAAPGLMSQLVGAINNRQDIDNVFLTEYPDPTTGPFSNLLDPDGYCGLPGPDPGFYGFGLINEAESQWASSQIVAPLNALLASTVAMGNAAQGNHPVWHLVSDADAFAGHGFCTGVGSVNPAAWFVPRYVSTPTDSLLSQGDASGSMHPNDTGQQVIANIMDTAYQSPRLLSASVTVSAPIVAQSPSSFTVQSLTFTGTPVPSAAVRVDGSLVGYTDSSGTLNVNGYVFPTTGYHNITVQAPGYPEGQSDLNVQPRPYGATSHPSPIPVNTVIPALTLTATDSGNGQLVAGTFTVTSGTGNFTVNSGATAANVELTSPGYTTITVIGPNGKPITIRVPECPGISFRPDSSLYTPRSFDLTTC